MENDISYFRRRASEERAASVRARDVCARQIHIEMAERYEDLVRGMAASERRLGLSEPEEPAAFSSRATT